MGRSRNRRTAWLGIVATELPCTAPPARIDGVVTHLLCYRHGSEQSISLDVISEDRVVLIYSAGGEASRNWSRSSGLHNTSVVRGRGGVVRRAAVVVAIFTRSTSVLVAAHVWG